MSDETEGTYPCLLVILIQRKVRFGKDGYEFTLTPPAVAFRWFLPSHTLDLAAGKVFPHDETPPFPFAFPRGEYEGIITPVRHLDGIPEVTKWHDVKSLGDGLFLLGWLAFSGQALLDRRQLFRRGRPTMIPASLLHVEHELERPAVGQRSLTPRFNWSRFGISLFEWLLLGLVLLLAAAVLVLVGAVPAWPALTLGGR